MDSIVGQDLAVDAVARSCGYGANQVRGVNVLHISIPEALFDFSLQPDAHILQDGVATEICLHILRQYVLCMPIHSCCHWSTSAQVYQESNVVLFWVYESSLEAVNMLLGGKNRQGRTDCTLCHSSQGTDSSTQQSVGCIM